jgi:hypothetical protein
MSAAIDELSQSTVDGEELDSGQLLKPPRKGYLAFPPRQSTLRLPDTLLLYESSPAVTVPDPSRRRRRSSKKPPLSGNTFESQALELAGFMRRSIEKLELKERMKWDEDFEDWYAEADRRVRAADVGNVEDHDRIDVGNTGHELAASWLKEKTSKAT